MNFTPLLRPYFEHRYKAIERYVDSVEQLQRRELGRILAHGRHCLWGREHDLDKVNSYADFAKAVDVTSYAELRPLVMRMIAGERNLLWPGVTTRFAQSSGTSDGKSKFIPVTDLSLKLNHYRGGSDVISHYLHLYPQSRLFSGNAFILGGSFGNELNLPAGSRAKVGDLSANLIEAINPVANLVRIPCKKVALMEDWTKKLPALVEASLNRNVTNISGVPSWFLKVIQEVMARKGVSELHEVWPNLEVFFHGGISFEPYRNIYNSIIDPSRMRYLETYNASEGFFAIADSTDSHAMRMLIDGGVFYEFRTLTGNRILPAWEVEQGEIYELIITSVNGLWRFPLGDTVKIETVNPLRITIAGRTKSFINAFGEEVMVHNTDAALAVVCEQLQCSVRNYTAAPVYTTGLSRGHHQWLIEFETPPANIDEFARLLDLALTRENSDYQAKRSGNIFLAPLEVIVAQPGLFERWMAATGKLGGQRKVPRLANNRNLMDSMLEYNQPHNS
ncbi:MAG: GH3 auxin-responsive promoter family protein [Firmicutes bacterium]|nr:GH3 auxin-responsive promoter family protein [Bacillota bacterium]MCM1400476.1 GH3 auxin-responsive promoter family protein [Bacteroides sp.]MCM1477447.1 GH3 auxin-responsive promoter family protein [Bacteroides sp.]